MSRVLKLNLRQPADLLIARARAAAAEQGVALEGNGSGGQFRGAGIEGHYASDGDRLSITIVRKPMLVPWAYIESALTAFFA